jgi:hypothetical protein
MLAAFEEQNRCVIEICFHRWTTNELPDLSVVAKAWEKSADRRVAKPLGFVNVIWRAERLKTLEGLITFLLYQLDFQLASNEFASANTKRA